MEISWVHEFNWCFEFVENEPFQEHYYKKMSHVVVLSHSKLDI